MQPFFALSPPSKQHQHCRISKLPQPQFNSTQRQHVYFIQKRFVIPLYSIFYTNIYYEYMTQLLPPKKGPAIYNQALKRGPGCASEIFKYPRFYRTLPSRSSSSFTNSCAGRNRVPSASRASFGFGFVLLVPPREVYPRS